MESDEDYVNSPSPSVTILENCTINNLNIYHHSTKDEVKTPGSTSEKTSKDLRNKKSSRPTLGGTLASLDLTRTVNERSYAEPLPTSALAIASSSMEDWSSRSILESTDEAGERSADEMERESLRYLPYEKLSRPALGRESASLDQSRRVTEHHYRETGSEGETLILKRSRPCEKFEVVSHTIDTKRGSTDESEVLKLCEEITVKLAERVCERSKIFKGNHHGRCKEDVAVKIITKYTKENEAEIENLKSASEHVNVVTYYSSGFCKYRGKKALYIVMELCDTATLEKRIKNQTAKRSFAEKLNEILQIAKGLAHLHKTCEILHRDLKPQNILYKNGVCKISDFGLSKRMLPGKSNTRQSIANIGTDGWRAPETSDSEAYSSPSSDVYSLGLVFYYDLSDGIHPFGPDEESRQCYIRENRNLSLKECDNMPDGEIIRNLLSVMLSVNPVDRPDIESVLKHPAFWNIRSKLDFYGAIKKYEEYRDEQSKENQRALRSGKKMPTFNPRSIADELEKRSGYLGKRVLPKNWISALTLSFSEHVEFRRDGIKPKAGCILEKATGKKGKSKFDGRSVFSCVKFIRNRHEHHLEDRVHEDFTMTEEQFWKFYSGRYPFLFIYVYTVVRACLSDKSADDHFKELFKKYF